MAKVKVYLKDKEEYVTIQFPSGMEISVGFYEARNGTYDPQVISHESSDGKSYPSSHKTMVWYDSEGNILHVSK